MVLGGASSGVSETGVGFIDAGPDGSKCSVEGSFSVFFAEGLVFFGGALEHFFGRSFGDGLVASRSTTTLGRKSRVRFTIYAGAGAAPVAH